MKVTFSWISSAIMYYNQTYEWKWLMYDQWTDTLQENVAFVFNYLLIYINKLLIFKQILNFLQKDPWLILVIRKIANPFSIVFIAITKYVTHSSFQSQNS